ncbi:hypothetical protein [Aeromicrobium sp.]|uniref:hypothetical protein n=1 Tax=Aeromicrobium sp. TaxID=1871063 RepID=UPI0025BA89F3|nr:hypothetical protein [Aeromicrobium sp.]MCK5891740.1 hypothetical protein [Aeromicrobium sp.]
MPGPRPEIFFDEADDATELVKALQSEGYTTDLRREAFAGDDDAEDRAWVLVVTPFDDRVVEMVDVYGGWMPGDERLPGEPVEGPPLPDAPKRLKRE